MLKPKSVNEYLEYASQWKPVLEKLRSIFLEEGLEETIKWNFPVYTYKNKNIVSLGAYKNHTAIWFFYGSFLIDEQKALILGETAKTMMQMRFLTIESIDKDLIHNFVQQSILLIDKGIIIPKVVKKEVVIPEALQEMLEKNSLIENFEAFTASKKREFCEYITSAKRETTVLKRLEKIIPLIKMNTGLNDKYRNC